MKKIFIGGIVLVVAFVVASLGSNHYQAGGNDRVAKVVLHKSLWERCFGVHVNEEKLRHQMIGTWEMEAVKSFTTPKYWDFPKHNRRLKTWTTTTWSIVTYDSDLNVVFSASGPYELHGNVYIENIETATGVMTNYIGHQPRFRIRVDGDKYYQLGVGNVVHEIWRRRGKD